MEEQALLSDEALLRRFEPVVRYTRGERFFPINVERYLNRCSLWVQHPGQPAECLVPTGELTLEKLVQPRQDPFGAVYYLKFIDPLDLIDLARYSINEAVKMFTHSEADDIFHSGRGRLARVGFVSRLLDALFSISFFLRGRVPGDTAAAAALTYQRMQAEAESYSYYGRTLRQGGWIVLQYWYFYPFNNWRTGFFGVNDHEGDWEMVCVYCYERPDLYQEGVLCIEPMWTAYASHDFSGDDLRRRWDDPEIEKIGEHPVIYAGAGSHASYYSPGEYLAELELNFLSPLVRTIERLRAVWDRWLHIERDSRVSELNIFRIPFVDYARGDGISIGPDQSKSWNACILNPVPAWAKDYRGLWGLYARDPISGENAPGGPMYNRDGSVRRRWFDPVGWAGMDKVATPTQAQTVLEDRRADLLSRKEQLIQDIANKEKELEGLGLELSAIQVYPHLSRVFSRQSRQAKTTSAELVERKRELTVIDAELEAFGHYQEDLQRGNLSSQRAHIRRPQHPSTDVELRLNRLAETFAAASIGLLMIGIVLLVVFARHYLLIGLAAMIGFLIFAESGFHRQLSKLIASLTTGLAIVSLFVILFEFFWWVVVGLVLAAGLYLIWDNIREVWT